MAPPTPAQNLQAAYQNVCANLAAITANPKPTYNVDGVNVNWQEYYDSLVQRMLELEQAIQRAQGPYELRSRGTS